MDDIELYKQRVLNPRRQRVKPRIRDRWAFVSFWTLTASSVGMAVGTIAAFKRRSYRKWAMSLAPKQQIQLLRENSGLVNQAADTTPRSRFSTLPHAMDTRRVLAWAGDFKPKAPWELGPLQIWNFYQSYPFFSEWLAENAKWCCRGMLLVALTLAQDSIFTPLLGYRLGSNPLLYGVYGTVTGLGIISLASLGALRWRTIAMISSVIGLWFSTLITMYNDSYKIALENVSWLAVYFPSMNDKLQTQEAQKAAMWEIGFYEVYLLRKGLLEEIEEDPSVYDTLSGRMKRLVNMSEDDWQEMVNDYTKGTGRFSEDIMSMTSEERHEMSEAAKKEAFNISDDRFPMNMFKQEKDSWVHMNPKNTGGLLTTDTDEVLHALSLV